MSTLSVDDQRALDALRSAVTEALERKRRLGEYAVIWRDGQVVRIEPEEDASSEHPGAEREPCLRSRALNARPRTASSACSQTRRGPIRRLPLPGRLEQAREQPFHRDGDPA